MKRISLAILLSLFVSVAQAQPPGTPPEYGTWDLTGTGVEGVAADIGYLQIACVPGEGEEVLLNRTVKVQVATAYFQGVEGGIWNLIVPSWRDVHPDLLMGSPGVEVENVTVVIGPPHIHHGIGGGPYLFRVIRDRHDMWPPGSGPWDEVARALIDFD